MTTTHDRARFHVQKGPEELFDRVRYVLNEQVQLKFEASHANDQAMKRDAPIERLKLFQPKEWELMTAEVRVDKGKFTRTGWRTLVDGNYWWVVRGYANKVLTVYESDKRGLGEGIITEGPLHQEVSRINGELMKKARQGNE